MTPSILHHASVFNDYLMDSDLERTLNPRPVTRYNAVVYSLMTTAIFRFFARGIQLCVFVGCDNAPRVRFAKDNYDMFHFQWDLPLNDERIILVR